MGMEFIPWSTDLSVGIPAMDAEHQQLVGLINELYLAMDARDGDSAAPQVLDRVIQYTETHFADEERLMDRYQFPKLAEHTAAHAQLTQQAKQLQADVMAGKRLICISVLMFLKNWIETHIQQEDREYGVYIQAHR
jgi:hemerythrin